MDLKFIWIKKFRNIEEQGFSFTDKFIISYSSTSKELAIKPNENALSEGFYADNIVSLTGILGENGAGKSNILDFLMTRIASVANGSSVAFEDKYFIILGNILFKHKEIYVANENNIKALGFLIIEFDESLEWLNGKRLREINIRNQLYSTRYLFYASHFERSSLYETSDLINVSTSYLINKSALERDDFPAGYYNKEVKDQIELLLFLNDNPGIKLPFGIPNRLHISVTTSEDVIKKINMTNEFFETSELKELAYIKNDVLSSFSGYNAPDLTPLQQLTTIFSTNFLLINVKQNPQLFSEITPTTYNSLVFFSLEETNKLPPDLRLLYENLVQFKDLLNSLFKKNLMLLDVEEDTEPYKKKIYNSFSIIINDESKEYFINFFTYYNTLSKKVDIIKRFWFGLSSGQQAFFNIYSRFFEAYRRIEDDKEGSTIWPTHHCTILIDEGETYYHPQWQKQFIKQIIDFISQLFINQGIQIIVASNSPFIASDIPTSNLIFIKRGDQGRCIVDTRHRQDNTFAANIHTLLTDSFFLQEGLMGDFAKQKINTLIEYLRSPDTIHEGKTANDHEEKIKGEMKHLMQIIGEPVIRHKLEEMWAEKFGVEEEIKLLEKRLQEARINRNNRND